MLNIEFIFKSDTWWGTPDTQVYVLKPENMSFAYVPFKGSVEKMYGILDFLVT